MDEIRSAQSSLEIAIIGAGTVGTALGVLAARAGHRVVAIAGRRDDRVRAAARRVGGDVRVCAPAEAARRASCVLITVPDDAIAPVCDALATDGALRSGAIVAHCSGALTSDALASARDGEAHCRVASLHPLQTFPSVDTAVDQIPGSYFFIEGDDDARAPLEALVAAIGGRSVAIATSAKVLYHAAAVMACNHFTALIDAALAIDEHAGIDRGQGWSALEPLVGATLSNIGRLGSAGALTGPIARGDVATVRAHLTALAECDPELEALYRALARWTMRLAAKKGTVSEPAAAALEAVLEG